MNNKELGQMGEKRAVNFLIKSKYKILEKNYKNKCGEIDIIAQINEYLVFVEVKTRSNTNFGLPCQAVNYHKQNTIAKVASIYFSNMKMNNLNCRFDIIEILVEKGEVKVTHLIDAFQPNL